MTVPYIFHPFVALLKDRKFQLTFLAFAAAFILYAQGLIDAEQLMLAINALITAVVGSIALMDAGAKLKVPDAEGDIPSLFYSRKFWLVLIGVIAAVIMFARGMVTADQMLDTVVWLLSTLVGGIALEGAAQNYGSLIGAAIKGEEASREG